MSDEMKATSYNWQPPDNLMICSLYEFDKNMLISPDQRRVEVSIDALCKMFSNPPLMLARTYAKRN